MQFDVFLSPEAWLGALFIFALRLIDMSLDTLRMLFVVRGRKVIAWFVGFFKSFLFVVAITSVLRDINNPLTIIGYSAGFATGGVVGMYIESKLALGHTHLKIISTRWGAALAESLRMAGYAVTEIPARGKDGMVSILSVSVLRKDVADVQRIINEKDPDAFVTSEDVRPLRRGYWRA